MSYDLMIFDPQGLAAFSGADLVQSINQYVAANEAAAPTTEIVMKFIGDIQRVYGDMTEEDSPWAAWPPSTMANGRYCIFSISFSADTTDMLMFFSDFAKQHGLILIDPQGKKSLITAPNGGGLLD